MSNSSLLFTPLPNPLISFYFPSLPFFFTSTSFSHSLILSFFLSLHSALPPFSFHSHSFQDYEATRGADMAVEALEEDVSASVQVLRKLRRALGVESLLCTTALGDLGQGVGVEQKELHPVRDEGRWKSGARGIFSENEDYTALVALFEIGREERLLCGCDECFLFSCM